MPIRGIPETCTSILRVFLNKDEFIRTVRNSGNYYYKHIKYPRIRIVLDQKNKAITFRREYSTQYGTRKESIILNYKTKEICKLYTEPTLFHGDPRCRKYMLVINEDQHFQQSLIEDKYYPTFEDMNVINDLYLYFLNDTYIWSNELKVKADARRTESAKAWDKNHKNWVRQLMINKNKKSIDNDESNNQS